VKAANSDSRKFPLGTIAFYGPDNQRATKLVAAVFKHPGQSEPEALHRWIIDQGDVRNDPVVAAQMTDFLKQYNVVQTVMSDRIIGCPHEEGIDYPLGEDCPQCPFWAGLDRFSHQPRQRGSKIGRNDPCPCGSGKKFKKCCGK
jgi:hypothetical protein